MIPRQISIEDLLMAKEGEQIQFKEAKRRFDSDEAAQICCALANCGGGMLVLGITDKRPRKVVGSEAFDQPERTRKGLIDKLKVMVDFQILNDPEGRRVLVFSVASRPMGLPVQVDGVAWWYEGDSLIPMPENVRRRIYEETGIDFSGSICTKPNSPTLMKPPSMHSVKNGLGKVAISAMLTCPPNSCCTTAKRSQTKELPMPR